MPSTTATPFLTPRGDKLVPNPIAHGGWGPTLGGQVVGGLLARAIEAQVDDPDLHPARLTVEILRRVATEPVRVSATVVRAGGRMRAVDAAMIQDGHLVARASALYLRRGTQPAGEFWSTALTLPPIPAEPTDIGDNVPMFIRAYGPTADSNSLEFPWQQAGPRYAWVREFRDLVAGEAPTPFHPGGDGGRRHQFDDQLQHRGPGLHQCRLHPGAQPSTRWPVHRPGRTEPHQRRRDRHRIDRAVDHLGPIGTGLSTAISNSGFDPKGKYRRPN